MKSKRIHAAGAPQKLLHGEQLSTFVPLTFASRENRTLLLRPEGATVPKPRLDLTLLRMLGKSFYWQQRLDEGQVKDVTELATQEKLDRGWINETLRLTLLAPDIVEAILQGYQPRTLTMRALRRKVPVIWEEQRALLGFSKREEE